MQRRSALGWALLVVVILGGCGGGGGDDEPVPGPPQYYKSCTWERIDPFGNDPSQHYVCKVTDYCVYNSSYDPQARCEPCTSRDSCPTFPSEVPLPLFPPP